MSLSEQFDCLERKKAAFLVALSVWTPEQLRFRPAPSAWSALQVVDHVLKTETGIFAEMRSNLPGARKAAFKYRLRGSLLNALMGAPVRLKVPAAAALVLPDNAPDLPEMAKSWNELRSHQKVWVASLAQDYSSKGVFRHPVSGWMTPSLTLGFLSAHLHHHGYQLTRIRRDPAWARCTVLAG